MNKNRLPDPKHFPAVDQVWMTKPCEEEEDDEDISEVKIWAVTGGRVAYEVLGEEPRERRIMSLDTFRRTYVPKPQVIERRHFAIDSDRRILIVNTPSVASHAIELYDNGDVKLVKL